MNMQIRQMHDIWNRAWSALGQPVLFWKLNWWLPVFHSGAYVQCWALPKHPCQMLIYPSTIKIGEISLVPRHKGQEVKDTCQGTSGSPSAFHSLQQKKANCQVCGWKGSLRQTRLSHSLTDIGNEKLIEKRCPWRALHRQIVTLGT
jgi:hypothetical protein